MSDNVVGVQNFPAAANIAEVDVSQVTQSGGTSVQRQRMIIASDSQPDGVAPVDRVSGLSVNVTNTALAVVVGNDPTTPLPVTGQVTAALAGASGLPIDPGQKPMAFSLPVTVASDQPPLNVAVASAVPQSVTAADGALATAGTTQDAAVYGDGPGSIVAQLRGENAQLATLNAQLRQVVDLLGAVLAQLNNIGMQQGAAPTVSPVLMQ